MGGSRGVLQYSFCSSFKGGAIYGNIRRSYLMRMNIQDIYQERELVLVVIKVGLLLLGIKLGLIFVGV